MEQKRIIKVKLNFVLIIMLVSILLIGTAFFIIKNNQTQNLKSIKIRYAGKQGLVGVEMINQIAKNEQDKIDIIEVNVSGNRLLELNKILNDISFKQMGYLDLTMMNKYEINVDDEYKILVDNNRGIAYYIKNNESGYFIEVPKELYDIAQEIVQENIVNND